MRIEFLPWDDRLACVHLVYHVWGPVLKHPVDPYVAWALYFADPKLFAAHIGWIRDIVHRLAWGKPLRKEQRDFVKRALRLRPPAKFKELVLENYKKLQEEWKGLEEHLEEVVSRAHGGDVLRRNVKVFPSVHLRGCGGSGYIDEVGISLSFQWCGREPRVLAHELIHVFHQRDKEFDALLGELGRKYKLPIHEVHAEALTNIFWWRAGKAGNLFHSHYRGGWKELEAFERKYWEIVERWWKEGGDLKEMVRSAFG